MPTTVFCDISICGHNHLMVCQLPEVNLKAEEVSLKLQCNQLTPTFPIGEKGNISKPGS